MNKFKGFSEGEVKELALAVEDALAVNAKLSTVFEAFAHKYGRAKGSVRNFYYEFVKECEGNVARANKYFKSLPHVNKPVGFSGDEEAWLVRKILIGKKLNKSVRSTISSLAGGDERLALRYQNKYRNVLKNNVALVKKTAEELGVEESEIIACKNKKVAEITLKQLKVSINSFVEKIADDVKKENEGLKSRLLKAESENRLLRALLNKNGSAEMFVLPNEAGRRVN